ncbi:MAG: type II toxin-antitoxin system HicB family antitoxin [Armatimonadetes bacterium]|nr:type II toxin-antitoxin system HicB family antitoxin [Armatimonadota bacterium]
MTYTVVLRPEPEGEFTVIVPALPGCFSRGRTVMECLQNAQEAIECYLESMAQHGEEFPVEGDEVTISTENLTEALIFRVSVAGVEALVA